MEKIIFVDVSLWQPKIDYDVLKANGVYGVIAKCSQGMNIRDPLFKKHIEGASGAGLRVGAYHWYDPTHEVQRQVANLLSAVNDADDQGLVDFMALDVEQSWSNWIDKSQKVPAHLINYGANAMMHRLSQEYGCTLQLALYTRTTFIHDHAPGMATWVHNWPMWLASWPYTKTRVKCTWDELRSKWLPRSEPKLPGQADRWAFWQFSGDKFILPGSNGRVIDLDYFNGSAEDYMAWIQGEPLPEPPKPGRRYKALYRLNARNSPNDMRITAIIGKIEKGQVINRVGWETVKGNRWILTPAGEWIAEVYSGVKLLEEVI